jgi:predicted AAA+ superfamily ATPase
MVGDSTCLFKREGYLEKIRGFYRDEETIKVITGVRQCGKSCLMKAIIEEIKDGGVDDGHITYLDLDRYGFRSVKTSEQLEALIEPVLAISGLNTCSSMRSRTWGGFEKVVNEFQNEGSLSIFITGSNLCLLSGELVTKLTGHYVEFEMQALNFKEYCDMKRFLGQRVNLNPTAELSTSISSEEASPRHSIMREWPTNEPISHR